MSSCRRYFPEHLISKAESYLKINQQITLEVGREHFALSSPEALKLAAAIVSSYHNQYVCTSQEYEDFEYVCEPAAEESSLPAQD